MSSGSPSSSRRGGSQASRSPSGGRRGGSQASRSPSPAPGRRGLRKLTEKEEYRPATSKKEEKESKPEPKSQADCPKGTNFRKTWTNKAGTRIAATCTKPRAGSGAAPAKKSDNPKPRNVSRDGTEGTCPKGYTFRSAYEVKNSKTGVTQQRPASCVTARKKGTTKADLKKAKMSEFGYNPKNADQFNRIEGIDEALAKMSSMGVGYPAMVLDKMEATKKEKGNVRNATVGRNVDEDIDVLARISPLQTVGGYALTDADDERAGSLQELSAFYGKEDLIRYLDDLKAAVRSSDLSEVIDSDIDYVSKDL